jgi:hypothetical protein
MRDLCSRKMCHSQLYDQIWSLLVVVPLMELVFCKYMILCQYCNIKLL